MAVENIGPVNSALPVKTGEENQVQRSQEGAEESTGSRGDEKAAASDRVSLTSTANQLRSIESDLSTQPAVDTQRVEAIRQTIADGNFQVDATRTAEKLLGLESALHGPTPPNSSE